METQPTLDVQSRTVVGKKVKYLRTAGIVPATIYGEGINPQSIQMDERSFSRLYRSIGNTTLIALTIDGKIGQSAFVQDVQRHPVTRTIMHADFRVVDLKAEMQADVSVTLVGVSPLVEQGDAFLNQTLNQVSVRALPANLPSHLEVDVSVLDDFDKSLYVSDLSTSPDYEIVSDPEEVVVTLSASAASRMDEEEEEDAEEAEPELIRREEEAQPTDPDE